MQCTTYPFAEDCLLDLKLCLQPYFSRLTSETSQERFLKCELVPLLQVDICTYPQTGRIFLHPPGIYQLVINNTHSY